MGFKSAKPFPSNGREVNADIFATQITKIEEIQKILQDNMFIVQTDHEYHTNRYCGPVPQ